MTLRSRLRASDVAWLALLALRIRPVRAALSVVGITVGVACVVAVLGVSASSQARLLDEIDALGTNLLTVAPGRTVGGDQASLPSQAPARITRLPGVQTVAAVATVPGSVFRNDRVPAGATGGIAIQAASLALRSTLRIPVAAGNWLTPVTERFPVTVLGTAAARRLGVPTDSLRPGADRPQIYLGGHWFTVVGVLGTTPLDASIDTAAFIGFPVARELFGHDGSPSRISVRTTPAAVPAVRRLLARATDPEEPDGVTVGRPSDALVARAAAARVFDDLIVGLGLVALLVGGVGVANVMVVAVVERRGEIGLRRALGARQAHVRRQILAESVLVSTLGGLAGLLVGGTVTLGYAGVRSWIPVLPPSTIAVATLGSIAIGALAGLYPATRAARMPPTTALRP